MSLGDPWPHSTRDNPTCAGRERITAAHFLALPLAESGGWHSYWRELKAGRWVIRYKGVSCGMVFWIDTTPIIICGSSTDG